jgi:diguanylate cyclase (GGDEF)-like protein/PAS domain S-box-containing protein
MIGPSFLARPVAGSDERLLRSLFDNTLIGIVLLTLEGRITYANSAYANLLGRSVAEMLELSLEDFIVAEDTRDIRSKFATVAKGTLDGYRFERRYIHKNGQIIHVQGASSVLRNKGRPPLIVTQVVDITSRKEAERKLAQEKEFLAITLASIVDAVICTDGEARITFMNPVAEKLTGWSSTEAAGQALPAVFHTVDEATGDHAADPVAQCLRINASCQRNGGVFLVSRAGGVSDIQFSAAPVRGSAQASMGAVLVFRDITETHAQQRKIAHSALHDALTGLPNRTAFLTRMNEAIDQARQERRTHALCFVDLDHFKQVNDRAGHAAGDTLLQEIAKVIALNCSKKDVPARLGGDEFALLIRDCEGDEATATAERIIAAISSMEFRWDMEIFRIGASIGATMVTADSPELGEILHQADKACYAAKASGRNRVCIYNRLREPQIEEFVGGQPRQDGLPLH